MLTGKAKQLFEEWLINQTSWGGLVRGFEHFPLSMQFGVYQQWGDSMNVEVLVFVNHHSGMFHFQNKEFKTREEAQRAAIEKLNQIINER